MNSFLKVIKSIAILGGKENSVTVKLVTLGIIFLCGIPAHAVLAAPIVPDSFSTTWDTEGSQEIEIFLGTCPVSVYWEEIGSSTNNGTTSSCSSGDITVTFPVEGQYRVDLSGSFTDINLDYFGNYGQVNINKFRTVEQWGDSSWTNLGGAFQYVPDLVFNASDVPDLSQATVMSNMFYNAINFNSDISNWDVSNVTDMWGMFWGATAFNQPLNSWEVSANTRFWRMFRDATSFNQPLDSWDVSNVDPSEGLFEMFNGASSFDQPLNNWDVSGIENLSYTFSDATAFNQPLDTWDTASATQLSHMFYGATSFNQALNNWDVSSVTEMSGIFSGATLFDQSVASWNIANATGMYGMFEQSALSTQNYSLILDGWALLTVQNGVDFGYVPSTYCDTAQAARDILTGAPNNWLITDDGATSCLVVDEAINDGGGTATRVGDRLKSFFYSSTTSSTPLVATKESFIQGVRNLIDYLTKNEASLDNLTPEESTKIIVGLREIITFLLKLIPGM